MIINLTVQSVYNGTLENTTLLFQVCNDVDGDCSIISNVTNTIYTRTAVVDPTDLFIIVGSLIGLIVLTTIIAGILCWKKKQSQSLTKKKSKNILCMLKLGLL